ncbi:DEAD/DEAH box helicase [Pseudomonas japonica]|uniref:DEAD/DEAH box helicase n=1 Tax=Pseudomonas japonica TaxID=256466 RepID=UPI0015E40814|nr:ATP-binding domain-containing protein [Pseudomonas japonica]MBA1289193.1 ATP-binding domain-containing protein [Pseudomonas japonica]
MSLDILVTTDRIGDDPLGRNVIEYLQENDTALHIEEGALYYDFPTYSDYDSTNHKPDLLLLSRMHGVIAIRLIPAHQAERMPKAAIDQIDESLEQFCSMLLGRLVKSRSLRKGRNELKLNITPVLLCDIPNAPYILEGSSCEIVSSTEGLAALIEESLSPVELSPEELNECRSVIEGAKALTKSAKRLVEDPSIHKAAYALSLLEAEIANFDQKQRRAALIEVVGPQRIRGLAGSGKTVILAMKAAHLHMTRPNEKILVTFFTKSLRSQIKDLITKFYRHYKEIDPNWENLHILHGWGGSNTNGVYADAIRRAGRIPISFQTAKERTPFGTSPFDYVCQQLIESGSLEAYYDHILIDEGQDFPPGFYRLCYELTKGEPDEKNIVWAYDDLQNILKVKMPSADELFGRNIDGQPRISLERASKNLPIGATNDTVLSKCYRNQRQILVMAHALGFGIYSEIVQLLESPDHWRDVGYEVQGDRFDVGQSVEIIRPSENSPVSLHGENIPALVECFNAPSFDAEIFFVVSGIISFLQQGLAAHDIIVVALDDKAMRAYFKRMSVELATRGIEVNNIHADPYSDPAFNIPNKITLSTVYRAKGNEAAVVFAIGVDAINIKARGERNKLFAAFTRTKAWLRISGCGGNTQRIIDEINQSQTNFPALRFIMPDLPTIDMIQRDLSEKAIKLKQLKAEYLSKLKDEGFSEDEITEFLRTADKND